MNKNVVDAARIVLEGGCRILAPTVYGHLEMSDPIEVAKCLVDPLGYEARSLGISRERLAAWSEWREDYRCTGTNLRGQRCGAACADCENPRKFVPGESDRCHHHVGH